ncbi:MAG: hypothetical protein PWR24_1231 [Desulfonauticus sp.]|jgi:uncharacterized protein YbbK (DUF523 family)|nr:hypothetical protein [Desulfonauticus sp.]
MKITFESPVLVSACLLGISSRYDGTSKPDHKILALAKNNILIPVCPEQLGGLPTPREPAEILHNKVITKKGIDVTKNFLTGAKETLLIARLLNIKLAILKQLSPSCGVSKIYDGSFSGKIVKGSGITARYLMDNGILVISEEEL